MANKKKEIFSSCSFCGKNQEEVAKLIAGPDVYICDECVALCNEIVHEDEKGAGDAGGLRAAALKPMQINDHLNEYVIGQEFAKKVLSVAVLNNTKRIEPQRAIGQGDCKNAII